MTKPKQQLADDMANAELLRRELDKGLASGVSKRTPAQVRADFRKAREAA